jgi:hypothetical protein
MKAANLPWIVMTSVALFCLHHWVMAQQAVQLVGGYRDWRVYGGSPDHIQCSALDQINRGNVGRLTVAWQYDSGDLFPNSQMECTAIVIGGVCSPPLPNFVSSPWMPPPAKVRPTHCR